MPRKPDIFLIPHIAQKLRTVLDPELGVSIVDLGLVYHIAVKGTGAHITMTLTTMGCPLFSVIESEIRDKLLSINGIDSVSVELTFDPPWSMAMISPSARMELGLM